LSAAETDIGSSANSRKTIIRPIRSLGGNALYDMYSQSS
jgi:hypothetical protein